MLPIFNSDVQELSLMQTKWASQLNPVIALALLKGRQINDVALQSGSNVIDHKLGRQPQGWFLVDLNANVTAYRTAWDELTITLTSSGSATAALYVY